MATAYTSVRHGRMCAIDLQTTVAIKKGKVRGVYVTEAHLLEQDHKQGMPEVALRNAAVQADIV